MSNLYNYKFKDDDFADVKSQKATSGDEWVMSFADVMTVLLCFFIVFYMIEKQFEKNFGFGVHTGSIQEYQAKMDEPEVQTLIETVKKIPKITMVNTAQFLEVHFPPEMFFESGSTKLTKEGIDAINTILEPLKDIKSGYYLQVQGYTDNTSVRDVEGRWWKDNMQLSLERSLQVYYYLKQNGVKENILTVTGFGANKPLINEAKDMQRRISLKFEPALYNKNEKSW